MSDLDVLRERIKKKRGIGDRQLQRLIRDKESHNLLSRRVAIMALAAENHIPIRMATQDELTQIRASVSGAPLARVAPEPMQVKRTTSGMVASRPTKRARPTKASTTKVGGRTRPSSPPKKSGSVGRTGTSERRNTVFVVHGRNMAIKRSMFSFLRCIGIEPMEWQKAIRLSGKPNPTIHEILNAAFQAAKAIVVVLTPDDDVMLREQLRKSDDPDYESKLTGQARANVLFEAGMAMGANEERTVLVSVGNVKPFSDIGGRHVTALRNDPESRREFVTKLENAGCNVDTDGADWFSEGDFRI